MPTMKAMSTVICSRPSRRASITSERKRRSRSPRRRRMGRRWARARPSRCSMAPRAFIRPTSAIWCSGSRRYKS
jgi:hypothetical protein